MLIKLMALQTSIIVALGAVIALTSRLWLRQIGNWLECTSQLKNPSEDAEAIVVLCGDGIVRTRYGVYLYKRKVGQELWITGNLALPDLPSFSEGIYAFRFAVESGVPPDSIHLLTTASTWEDAQETARLAMQRNTNSVLIVTSWYHVRRTILAMRRHFSGTTVRVLFTHPLSTYGPANWWKHEDGLVLVLGELAKLVFYWWRYKLNPFADTETSS